MIRFIKKIVFIFTGVILMIAAVFVAVAGAAGGLGATRTGLRVAYVLAGILAFMLGFYLYYQGSNKNILKAIGDIIDAIIINI